nr:coatomer subunit beta-like [Lytechinus pictus]
MWAEFEWENKVIETFIEGTDAEFRTMWAEFEWENKVMTLSLKGKFACTADAEFRTMWAEFEWENKGKFASCTDAEFRTMWAEFEWENKVTVNTNINDLREYLKHLISSTNMRCLTPEKGLSGECGFMAANLYARSIFGEDALANVSIENSASSEPNAPVTGHVRIRAKSQGMALSMGDKINLSQKKDKDMK